MGIKDWFGGNKKKEEFREKAKETFKNAKLTPGKALELNKLAEEFQIEDAGDDKTMLRKEVYNAAVGSAKARGKLTDQEAAELAKIQKFLALRDDQVDKTKRDLNRLKLLTEIRQGNLPTLTKDHPSLRGLMLDNGEIPHWSVQVDVLDRPTTMGRDGVPVKWKSEYVSRSAKVHGMPADGAKELGEGYLVITDKRVIFKGDKAAAVPYTPQAEFFLYAEGLRIQRTVGNTLLKFKSGTDDTAEVVGELLAALMR
ncbi:hypothetical protein BWI17_06450 [Betaproteobacteria bacterium GR16-43]|nr:hypothetical protein BWI17_06450 [Betaproteobacteria bacterium GR16-43]